MARSPTLSVESPSRALRRTKRRNVVFDVTERRHPRFNLFEKHWRFLLESYDGGPEYLWKGIDGTNVRRAGQAASITQINSSNLWRYFKEGEDEYRDRLLRAHRNNYSKKVVDQIRSFVARKPPTRRPEQASQDLRRFWDNVDGRGRDADRFFALVLQWVETFGIVWLNVDKPPEIFDTALEEREAGMPFVKTFFPFDVLDGGFDDVGRLKWIFVRESRRIDPDPMLPSPVVDHFMAWDRFTVRTFIKNTDGKTRDEVPFILVGQNEHNLGVVPFVRVAFSESEYPFVAPGLLDDIAYLDRDVYNKQSQLDTIILDQTFSQLAIPADALILNEAERTEKDDGSTVLVNDTRQTTRTRLIEMGTKRVFLFNGNTGQTPTYISPDADQAGVIRNVITDEITEIYRLANLLGDVGREARTQTGVSKAYDFDRLNKVLAFAAGELEMAEFAVADLAERWLQPFDSLRPGTQPAALPDDLVSYPENFDIMGLLELLDIAFRSDEVDLWSPTADRMVRDQLIARMFPNATLEQRKQIEADLDKREKQQRELAERSPLEMMMLAEQDRAEFATDREEERREDDRSQVRGAGGGARRPTAGQPTRPTTQQARDS